MNNDCIIEEDNEEDTDGQNTQKKYNENSESEEEVLIQNNSIRILDNSHRESQESSQNQMENKRYSKENSRHDTLRNNEQEEGDEEQTILRNNYDSNFSLGKGQQESQYDSNQHEQMEEEKATSTENELTSDDQEFQEEPVINKTLVMLQKELHKSLFSPSLMKINESPKVSLLANQTNKKISNIPNIFGMNIRPSSGEIMSPTSEESSRHSVRRDHLSKDNHYQIQDSDFIEN